MVLVGVDKTPLLIMLMGPSLYPELRAYDELAALAQHAQGQGEYL